MPEQFPTKWDFIIWAGTYLEKTAMNNWQKQKGQHNHASVTYNNYLKVLDAQAPERVIVNELIPLLQGAKDVYIG